LTYDNAREERFARLVKMRRLRLVSSVVVLAGALVVVTALANPRSSYALDVPRIILWLVATTLFLLLIVWGLVIETRRGLGIAVSHEGVFRQGRRVVRPDELKGARLEVKYGSIVAVSRSSDKAVLSIEVRDLANPTKFREALEELVRDS